VSRRDKASIFPSGRQSALTAIERHQVGLLRSVGGRGASILRIAEQMGRTRDAVRRALETVEAKEAMTVARAVMERNAENFALDWTVASQVAASEGNHKPARDALGAVGVVKPGSDGRPTAAITLVMPFTLGALSGYRGPGIVEARAEPVAVDKDILPAGCE
jgi:hypothetical protein